MEYVLARIQVLKNQKPATAMVYTVGDKEIAMPLKDLSKFNYIIVCPFEQNGSTYLILQNTGEE